MQGRLLKGFLGPFSAGGLGQPLISNGVIAIAEGNAEQREVSTGKPWHKALALESRVLQTVF